MSGRSRIKSRSAAEPGESCGADRREFLVVQQAYSAADHAEDAAREHDPGFCVGVALHSDRSLVLTTPDQVRDEVVDFAHVTAQVALQLRVLRCLAQRLHPELRELELRRTDGD